MFVGGGVAEGMGVIDGVTNGVGGFSAIDWLSNGDGESFCRNKFVVQPVIQKSRQKLRSQPSFCVRRYFGLLEIRFA